MRPNPLTDVIAFLAKPEWETAVYWLLLLGSILIAVRAWRHDSTQRTTRHVGIYLSRLLIGAMWWEQSLWKVPPNYDGLIYWMKQMVDHATTQLQSTLVRDFVLPNIGVFGALVYFAEVAVAVSLMLGFLSRLGAALGAVMALNLWLGLYSAPGEWPWTYFFLIVIQVLFTLDPPGRSLGADARVRWPAILRWLGPTPRSMR